MRRRIQRCQRAVLCAKRRDRMGISKLLPHIWLQSSIQAHNILQNLVHTRMGELAQLVRHQAVPAVGMLRGRIGNDVFFNSEHHGQTKQIRGEASTHLAEEAALDTTVRDPNVATGDLARFAVRPKCFAMCVKHDENGSQAIQKGPGYWSSRPISSGLLGSKPAGNEGLKNIRKSLADGLFVSNILVRPASLPCRARS